MLTGELKQKAIALLQEYVGDFKKRRAEISDEIMRQYMTPRKLEWKGNPNPKPRESKKEKSKETNGEKDKPKA